MKQSITATTKELRDRSQIILRKIAEIADSTLPSIKNALEQSILRKSDFREKLLKYVEKNRYNLGGFDGVDLSDPNALKPDISLISRIPFSVLLALLGPETQKNVFNAIDGATYRASAPMKWHAEGELRVELSNVRIALLTTSEIFNDDVFVPTVEVGPQVNFSFNNRRDNNGNMNYGWLPNPQNVSPVGSFAQVESIRYGVLIDLDTAVKAYWTSQKNSTSYPKSEPINPSKPESNVIVTPLYDFINRGVASIVMTYLASVSRSIGIFNTALNELINPLTNILDETFLEYADLDSPRYTLVDRKSYEPHWIRFNISKASALIDATIRGLNSEGRTGGDKRYWVFSEAMGALIRGFFYHKYKLRNLMSVQNENTVIPLPKLAEKSFEQLDRAKDPMFFHEMSEIFNAVTKNSYMYLQERDQTSGLGLAQQNGVMLLQKTMVLIAYSSLMIHAESGLDRKYNQFNNFFGRKGGYKAMVKKIVYVLHRHLDELLGDTEDKDGYKNRSRALPINRWKVEKNNKFDFELVDLCETLINIVPYEIVEEYYKSIIRESLSFYNSLQVPFYPHYDDLSESLAAVLELMRGAQGIHNEEGQNDGPGTSTSTKLPLENYVRPFFGTDGKPFSNSQFVSGKTVEQFNTQLDEIIARSQENESLDFCGGFASPVTMMFSEAEGLDNEIEIRSGIPYAEDDPKAEENFQYVQEAKKALERFESWLLSVVREAQRNGRKSA